MRNKLIRRVSGEGRCANHGRGHELEDGLEDIAELGVGLVFHGGDLADMWRSFTKARTTVTLIWTACGLFSTMAAMMASCSVKA